MRPLNGTYTLGVEILNALDVIADRFPGDGKRVEEKRSRLARQLPEQRRYATGSVDILDVPLPIPVPRRRHLREVRHTLCDIVKSREGIFDPRFMGHRNHVQQGVGGSAHCDIERNGVVDRVGGDDVAEADAAAEKLEELVRGGAGELMPPG